MVVSATWNTGAVLLRWLASGLSHPPRHSGSDQLCEVREGGSIGVLDHSAIGRVFEKTTVRQGHGSFQETLLTVSNSPS